MIISGFFQFEITGASLPENLGQQKRGSFFHLFSTINFYSVYTLDAICSVMAETSNYLALALEDGPRKP